MTKPLETAGRPFGTRRIRVIPTLLMDGNGRLVKTVRFGKRTYIGDPINAVRIFNEKEVDELVLLDIDATIQGRGPDFERIADIVSEAFMPVAYGGGVSSEDQIVQLYQTGIEKVVLSSSLEGGTALVSAAARRFGAQAVTVCLPVSKALFGGLRVKISQGRRKLAESPESIARRVVEAGAGELLIYSIDRDGTFAGYDLDLLQRITDAVDVPVVACGGARGTADFAAAVLEAGCAAVAAGSQFVYQSQRRGVLINYPAPEELDAELNRRLPRRPS